MKFNEPVRPAGIGRKQVAFNINRNPSAFTIVEEQSDNHTDPESVQAQNTAAFVQATAMSRAIAYSAASSAMVSNQNDIWSTQNIQNWSHTGNAGSDSFSYIKWANPDPDNLNNIRSGLAYVDREDPTIIRVNKAGWYFVSLNFYQGDHSLNNYKNELFVVSADSPDTTTAKVRIESKGYPSLSICQLVPVPGYNSEGKAVPNSSVVYTTGGLKCVYLIGPHSGTLNMTSTNSYASIQIVWLRPWEENYFYNGA